ncbi:MAG: beta-lactamase family protein [Alphaproteobacteria bacterium]|nr:beta-lactamase family protein [Alphaproteobacteria bacterium]
MLCMALVLISVVGSQSSYSHTQKSNEINRLSVITRELKEAGERCQGAAICLLYKGEPVYEACFGYQEEGGAPITPDTIFSLASVSKPLVSVGTMLMVSEGMLSFERKEKIPSLKYPVSLCDILSHTTGYTFRGDIEIEANWTRARLDESISRQKPACHPGGCYLYSNYLYGYAGDYFLKEGLTLEGVIGHLKKALKTKGPYFVGEVTGLKNVAIPHKTDKKDKHKLTRLSLSSPYFRTAAAAAGLFASLNDMKAFARLTFGREVHTLSSKNREALFTPVLENRDLERWGRIDLPAPLGQVKSWYCLGWRKFMVKDKPETVLIFHSGYVAGVNTFIGHIPSNDLTLIFLSNQDGGVATRAGLSLWTKVFK